MAANDGEVEDYALTIAPAASYDYGDAPATYGTPNHTIVAGIYLGTNAPDSENAPQTPLDGTGDDITGSDDEDGMILPAFSQGQTATISATVNGVGGYLQGWIDFNGDGDFADVGEQIATNLQDNGTGDTDNTTGKIAFSVTVPATATTSQIYARFRWSTMKDLTATTAASDGEAEDYALTLTASKDYGDAPATYGTPSHVILAGMHLGATIDSEAAARPTPAADGDGTDEDGVTISTLTQGLFATVTVQIHQSSANQGYLQGWIDWNADGDFLDGGEQIAITCSIRQEPPALFRFLF